MIDEYTFKEIFKLPCDKSTSILEGLDLLIGLPLEIKINKKNFNTYYSVKVEDILKSNLTVEDLIKLRNGDWNYIEDNETLIKDLNK